MALFRASDKAYIKTKNCYALLKVGKRNVNSVYLWLLKTFDSEINFLDFQKSEWPADITIKTYQKS